MSADQCITSTSAARAAGAHGPRSRRKRAHLDGCGSSDRGDAPRAGHRPRGIRPDATLRTRRHGRRQRRARPRLHRWRGRRTGDADGQLDGRYISVVEAAAHHGAVTSMALVAPAVPGPHVRWPEPLMLSAIAALSIPGLAQTLLDRRLRVLGPEALVKNTLALVATDPSRIDSSVVDAHVRLTEERQHLGRQNARAFIQASRSIGFRMADPRFWARVAAVSAPTLVIHGSLDRLIPLSAARELPRRRPDWKLEVLDGVGHVPMMEAPDQFMDALEAWSAYRIPTAAAVS